MQLHNVRIFKIIRDEYSIDLFWKENIILVIQRSLCQTFFSDCFIQSKVNAQNISFESVEVGLKYSVKKRLDT